MSTLNRVLFLVAVIGGVATAAYAWIKRPRAVRQAPIRYTRVEFYCRGHGTVSILDAIHDETTGPQCPQCHRTLDREPLL